MPISRLIVIVLAALMTGCANMDGKYVPSCTAFEGDRFDLRDGRFTWSRFTDERVVGDDGKEIDPFPDHPKQGSFKVTDKVLELTMDDGSDGLKYVPVRFGGDVYLLKPAENDAYVAGSPMPECALKRSDR